jgi:two-component system NtrC family sensor kinase
LAANNGWKIVLIDDEAGIRKVTGISLKDSGYEVHTAQNGEEGIRLCEAVLPQIVITDVKMPGMDGIAVLEVLKNTYADMEVIVATAFGEMDVAIRALQLDASDFITKPINDTALELALERAKNRYTAKKQIEEYTKLLEEGWNETTAELLETFAFQNNLIESSMDGIIGCNAQGKVAIFNKSIERILGYAKSDVIHKTDIAAFFLPEEENRLKKEMAGLRYGGPNRLYMFETTMKTQEGQYVPVQISASAVYEQESENGFVCFVRDLREIRKLEREVEDQAKILHQDKMMSLGRLSASVVHEINNPLAGVLNYTRLMIRILNRGPLAGEHQDRFLRYLNLIESETDRISTIVSSLLTFSRKSPAACANVKVDKLLHRCILLSRHKLELSNIEIHSHIDADLPEIDGDFNQLQQCVINLVFNAIDAMPKGGRLDLSGRFDVGKQLVEISIKDNGLGISEKNLPHIFEPFFTTKDEGYGVGLGLSTLYGIMEHHGATVVVESKIGLGTTFTLRFPSCR